MSIVELKNTAGHGESKEGWGDRHSSYRCHICTIREEDGTFSVIVLNLPGCGSCGDTKEEAQQNVREAILGVIESHLQAGEQIPWKDSTSKDIPEGCEHKWIIVNA